MDKQQVVTKAKEAFTPLETQNVVAFVKELNFKTIIDSPLVLGILVVVLFYAVIKRSKFVLLFLFTLLSLMALIHYSLPGSDNMTVTSLLPFAFGCLGIGSIIIYFSFIKVE